MKNQHNHTNQQNSNINNKFHINILSLSDLKTYIKLKYSDYQEAGRGAGISKDRVRQIVNGFRCPKTPKLIHQIAQGWDVDPIKLTLIFSNCNNEQKTPEKEFDDEMKKIGIDIKGDKNDK